MISVIVPIYKVEKYLDKCVQSIINQTYTDLEIILVDDGSPDNCGKMCDEYAEKDERIKVIHKENGGLSDARNAGVEKATGDYVCFIDSDDFAELNMVEVLVSAIGDCDVCTCGVYNDFADKSVPQYEGEPQSFDTDNVTAFKLMLEGKVVPATVCNKLIKTNIAKTVQFPKGRLYEDAFYQNNLMKKINKIHIETKPLYHYAHRNNSITTKPFKSKDMDVIYAYKDTEQLWKDEPELNKYIRFRILWAYFVVLDRILLMPEYKQVPEYAEIISFLKANALEVFFTNLFNKSRRIAALALKINVKLYRKLVLVRNKRQNIS